MTKKSINFVNNCDWCDFNFTTRCRCNKFADMAMTCLNPDLHFTGKWPHVHLKYYTSSKIKWSHKINLVKRSIRSLVKGNKSCLCYMLNHERCCFVGQVNIQMDMWKSNSRKYIDILHIFLSSLLTVLTYKSKYFEAQKQYLWSHYRKFDLGIFYQGDLCCRPYFCKSVVFEKFTILKYSYQHILKKKKSTLQNMSKKLSIWYHYEETFSVDTMQHKIY